MVEQVGKGYNAAAVGAIGVYLIGVGYQHNAIPMFKALSEESKFLKFGIAILLVGYILDNFPDKKTANILRVFLYLGIGISMTDAKAFDFINNFFKG